MDIRKNNVEKSITSINNYKSYIVFDNNLKTKKVFNDGFKEITKLKRYK